MFVDKMYRIKPKHARSIEAKELDRSFRYPESEANTLLFQAAYRDQSWDGIHFVSLWKTCDKNNKLVIKINQAESKKTHLTGFDKLSDDSKKSDYLTTNSIRDFVCFMKEVINYDRMVSSNNHFIFSIPLLVAAFEGEGAELFITIRKGKRPFYLKEGGSCFGSLFDSDIPDSSYSNRITKKEYLETLERHKNTAMDIREEYREKHMWYSTDICQYFINNIFKENRY